MSCLNQINHWKKETQYKKQIKQNFSLDIFLSFYFAVIPNASPLTKEAQEYGTSGWHYSRKALEKIKNHYIEEDAEIYNNYI